MDIPKEILNNVCMFTSGSKYTARALGLTIDDLVGQIEDLGLNPIDFIWKAIDEEKRKRAELKNLLGTPIGKFWTSLQGQSYEMISHYDYSEYGYGLRTIELHTQILLPEEHKDIIITPLGNNEYHIYGMEGFSLEEFYEKLCRLDELSCKRGIMNQDNASI